MSDNPKLLGRWDGACLWPHEQYDRDQLGKYGINSILRLQVAKDRSKPHHRLYWAVLRVVRNNSPKDRLEEDIHWHIKAVLGMVDTVLLTDTGPALKVRSIAFDQMDQGEFGEFFNRAMDVIITDPTMMQGSDPKKIIEEAKKSCKNGQELDRLYSEYRTSTKR